MDNAKIEAALAALDRIGRDGAEVRVGVSPMWIDTGLTVAELREILEAARGQAWRGPSDPPWDNRTVLVEDDDGDCFLGAWHVNSFLDCATNLYIARVRRWRELPR